ncbi:phosphoglycerate mutase-like protein [Polyplosphaeria fusca]|uniref:Phosphoglycerate mutase-like protein n=1 Tax=Polyplosphaeria fusca TaxID=682080 RepID=A0A9P4V5U0_9PLEO|nr:phosphoglycerate mutase-like protein [Polyplosphaeria fusca]
MPPSAPILSILPLVAAVVVALLAVQYSRTSQCIASDGPSQHAGYFEYECAGKPHHATWQSWWHPQQLLHTGQGQTSARGAGRVTKDWNILYHLGGNGPWVEKIESVVEGGIAPPDGCDVTQVHMMARHAERYPTPAAATRMTKMLNKITNNTITLRGDLAFANNWQLFWSDDSQIAQLTSTGPFSGTLGAFTTGVRLRTRYLHLLTKARSQFARIRFWASDSPRVIDTARHFGTGFFGMDWQNFSNLEVISESSKLGGDTLTPGDTCLKYVEDSDSGHDYGYTALELFRATYLGDVRKRLLKQNPEMDFSDEDVYAMQEICGFEITVRGSSHWCDVFTKDEFLSFEYARDLLHFYRAGPGTRYGGTMGWLWLNATKNLLVQGPDVGPLFFSFVHDGDIAPMLTSLDIITDDQPLPLDKILHTRKWRKSQVSPMGGRIIFELLSCTVQGKSREESAGQYIRININDGITELSDCHSGPGRSCPLADFVGRVDRKGREFGDFREVCGLGEDAAERITFLHQ